MQKKSLFNRISLYSFHLLITIIFSMSYNPTIASRNSHDHEYIYDASELGFLYKKLINKDSFLVGLSTSEHQCSPECTAEICDWSRFVKINKLKDFTSAANFWKNGKTYIDQLKDKLHINALRISIEWALVQPEDPGSNPNNLCFDNCFDKKALQHYAELIAYLIKKNITPVICFHHYTSPCWFADRGGFETIENCTYFKNYCLAAYKSITDHLSSNPEVYQKWLNLTAKNRGILWATFNSPEGVAFKGYRQGEGPPSDPKKEGLYWVSLVLQNMMEAHVQAYQAIQTYAKLKPNTPKPKIGFLKNIIQFDYAPGINIITKAITAFACSIAERLNDTCIYDFFNKGVFPSAIPFVTAKAHYNQLAPSSLDWVGLNYYSNTYMRLFSRITLDPNDRNATDSTNYAIYPYGLYRALSTLYEKLAKPLNIPMYVTENGVATNDSNKKNRYYKGYLHELLRAIKAGIPVFGYLSWAAFDNEEWAKTKMSNPLQNDNRQYGLTSVSADGKTLTPKKGAQYFIDWAKSLTFRPSAKPKSRELEEPSLDQLSQSSQNQLKFDTPQPNQRIKAE